MSTSAAVSLSTRAVPFLFRNATPRISGSDIPGNYDPRMQVWVVQRGGVSLPIVEVGDNELLDLETTTKVRQESEDEDICRGHKSSFVGKRGLIELTTKTEVQQESDDDLHPGGSLSTHRIRCGRLSELATKTDVQQESDDQIESVGLVELQTKTSTVQEQDDERVGRYSILELETKTFVDVESDDDRAAL